MKRLTLLFAILTTALTQYANATPTYTIVDGTNIGATPAAEDTYYPVSVGWLYTPATSPYAPASLGDSFTVTDIGTEFGTNAWSTTPVTVDVYEDASLPSEIGTLIATGTLTAVADTMEYAALTPEGPEAGSSQVSLTVGDTYFIEFLNVAGLGENVTDAPGATSLSNWYYVNYYTGCGTSIEGGPDTSFHSAPILAFATDPATSAVPEPATWALLVASVVGLVFIRRLRLRPATARCS